MGVPPCLRSPQAGGAPLSGHPSFLRSRPGHCSQAFASASVRDPPRQGRPSLGHRTSPVGWGQSDPLLWSWCHHSGDPLPLSEVPCFGQSVCGPSRLPGPLGNPVLGQGSRQQGSSCWPLLLSRRPPSGPQAPRPPGPALDGASAARPPQHGPSAGPPAQRGLERPGQSWASSFPPLPHYAVSSRPKAPNIIFVLMTLDYFNLLP